jgi:hypothetical protein
MVTAPPDFIGIGAQRSGTSWWFSLLSDHPEIEGPSGHKELHFLSRFGSREPSTEDVADYAGWFPRPPGAIAGEWTPYYMVHCWLGALLARMAPAAKVVVMLRDPVERYASGITHRRQRQDFVPENETTHFLRGFYGEHLARLEPYVDDDALLVLQYEQCVREPHQQLARTFEFLGVEPMAVPDIEQFRGTRSEHGYELWPERRSLLVDAYRDDVERLVARRPEIDVALWKSFA